MYSRIIRTWLWKVAAAADARAKLKRTPPHPHPPKDKNENLDTLIFPNEDFIYVMKWRVKRDYFENLFMSTEKKVRKNILIRELFLLKILNIF